MPEIRPSAKRLNHLGKITKSPFFWIGIFECILLVFLLNAFEALPDPDTYFWLDSYQQNSFTELLGKNPARPLYYLSIILLERITDLNAIVILKYIIPLLSLVTLAPAWLVARQFTSYWQQCLLLLVNFSSPTLIISLTQPIPQLFLIIIFITFTYLLIYAHLVNKLRYHYLAGAIMTLGFTFHEAALIPLIIWLLTTTYWYKSSLLKYARHHIASLTLMAMAASSVLIAFAPLRQYIESTSIYFEKIAPYVFNRVEPNLNFPATYVTFEGVDTSWPGAIGVLEYYSFYAGPFMVGLFTFIAWSLITQPSFRHNIIHFTSRSPSLLVLVANMLIFLILAEIFPRLPGLALLPHRALLFLTTFSPTILVLIFINQPSLKLRWYLVAYFLLGVGLAGGIYINDAKKHFISDSQVRSATWLRNNTPEYSTIIIPHVVSDYLDTYTERPLDGLPEGYTCPPANHQAGSDFVRAIHNKTPPIFIYYYQTNQHNLYKSRPWFDSGTPSTCPLDFFNQYPEQFRPIYNDGDRAMIWEVIDL